MQNEHTKPKLKPRPKPTWRILLVKTAHLSMPVTYQLQI